jgi:hypothetical protein
MTSFGEVSRQIDGAEKAMRDAETRLAQFDTVKQGLAELVGHAEGADGQVIAEWSPGGLSLLELSPRVMRMPSADLADEIKKTIAAATADLREKTRALLTEAGLAGGPPPSLDEVRAQMQQLREQMVGSGRQAAVDIDRAAAVRRSGR